MATFGLTSDSGSSSASSVDKVLVSTASPASSGKVTGGSARLWLSGPDTVPCKFVIYSDSSGAPGNLLATSDELSVTNTTEQQLDFTFTGAQQINVTAGTNYFFGPAWQDPGAVSWNWSRSGTASSAWQQNTFTYPTMPNPYGTASTVSSGPIDAFVTYTPTVANTGGFFAFL